MNTIICYFDSSECELTYLIAAVFLLQDFYFLEKIGKNIKKSIDYFFYENKKLTQIHSSIFCYLSEKAINFSFKSLMKNPIPLQL